MGEVVNLDDHRGGEDEEIRTKLRRIGALLTKHYGEGSIEEQLRRLDRAARRQPPIPLDDRGLWRLPVKEAVRILKQEERDAGREIDIYPRRG